jgi:ribosomal protein S18 acetylase RimI-like enzyme
MAIQIVNLTDYPASEAKTVLRAAEQLARHNPYDQNNFRRLAYFLGPRHVLLLALDPEAGQLVGFFQAAHLVRKGYTSAYSLGVWPGARRQGVATALMTALMAASPGGWIRLSANPRNVAGLAFFARMGFVPVGEARNRSGETLTVLEWRRPG